MKGSPLLFPRLTHAQLALSLTELLVVIAILATLAVLSGPVFTDIGRSASLSNGGNQLVNYANLARQNSLGRNCVTALIVHNDLQAEDAGRAFTLLELTPPPSGREPQSSDWKQISKWELLPTGLVTDFAALAYPLDDSSTVPSSASFPQLTYKGTQVASFRYVLFYPNGGLNRPESVQMRLVEGFLPPEGSYIVYAKKDPNGEPLNFYDVTILAATGRTKIDRPQ